MDHWRLGCQCKVKGDLKIKVPESVMGVKEWECEVISNMGLMQVTPTYSNVKGGFGVVAGYNISSVSKFF